MIPSETNTLTIAAGGSLSDAIDLGPNNCLRAIVVPAGWSGTTPITFQVSVDEGVTWYELYDSTGTEVQFAITGPSTFVVNANPAVWQSIRYIKARSGTAAAPVTQEQDVTLTVIG